MPMNTTHPDFRCKCTKTNCLKLYCDCFRRNKVCTANCSCAFCKNTPEHDREGGLRDIAVKETLDRRPDAFGDPITAPSRAPSKRPVDNGCSCKSSRCIKKYCACFNKKVACDPKKCRCVGCRNPNGAADSSDEEEPVDNASDSSLDDAEIEEMLSPSANFMDAGTMDVGTMDAGTTDAGPMDAGPMDAGTMDAGTMDAGPMDASYTDVSVSDASTMNASASDASFADASVDVNIEATDDTATTVTSVNKATGRTDTPTKTRKKPSHATPPTVSSVSCKCNKSKCLKLYCECFRHGLLCKDRCQCRDCENRLRNSGLGGERASIAKKFLDARDKGVGCSCTNNECRTGNCDCFASGTKCDPGRCTCIDCENMALPQSELDLWSPKPQRDEESDDPNIFGYKNKKLSPKAKGSSDISQGMNEYEQNEKASPNVQKQLDQLRESSRQPHSWEAAASNNSQVTNAVTCLEEEEPDRWNRMYQKLEKYVDTHGSLPPIPSSCETEHDRRLSIWIQENKSLVYAKAPRIMYAPHRIKALESLGVEWVETTDGHWNKMFRRLQDYKAQNNTVKLPSWIQCHDSMDEELIALRQWVSVQEKEVRSGIMTKRRDRFKKLRELGLPIQFSWEQEWEYQLTELLKFRSKYGHCCVVPSCEEHPGLYDFVSELLTRMKEGNAIRLTEDEMDDLRRKGLYFDLNKLLKRRPSKMDLQEEAKLLPLNRVKEVNYWAGMFARLKDYMAHFGTSRIPPPDLGIENLPGDLRYYETLSDWIQEQRHLYSKGKLEKGRVRTLEKIGVELDTWEKIFKSLKKYQQEAGTVRLPRFWNGETEHDQDIDALCRWLYQQLLDFRKDELRANKKKKLRSIGVTLTKSKLTAASWEERFSEMLEYHSNNGTCLPKRDGPLKQWVEELVDNLQKGHVNVKRQKMIDDKEIRPFLKPEVIYASSEPTTVGKKRKADSSEANDVFPENKHQSRINPSPEN